MGQENETCYMVVSHLILLKKRKQRFRIPAATRFSHVSLFPLLMIFLLLLSMPPRPQKKNDAGPAGRGPAGPASFFKLAPPAAARGSGGKTGKRKSPAAATACLDRMLLTCYTLDEIKAFTSFFGWLLPSEMVRGVYWPFPPYSMKSFYCGFGPEQRQA